MNFIGRKCARIVFGIFFLLPLISACFQASSWAGTLRMESETLGSARNGDDQRLEAPLYEFVGASYVSENRALALNTNFSLFADPKRHTTDFDIYILDLSFEAIPDLMTLKIGRFFDVYRSTRTMTSDTAGLEFSLLEKRVTLGAYGGVERELVLGKFDPSASVLGAYGSYRSSHVLPYFFSTRYRRRTYASTAKPIENTVQLSFNKAIPGDWSPEFLVDSETHVAIGGRSASSHLDRFEVGVDLYPSYQTSLRLRAFTYETLSNYGVEQPLFSIFSQGRLYEAMGQLEYRFTPKFFSSVAFGYDDYLLQADLNRRARGYRLEVDTRYVTDYGSISNAIYGFYSPGGHAYGDLLRLNQKLSSRLELQESAEITFYNKITSSKRPVISTQAGMNYWLFKRFKFYLGGELNTNNVLRYDVRVLTKLTYLLWLET